VLAQRRNRSPNRLGPFGIRGSSITIARRTEVHDVRQEVGVHGCFAVGLLCLFLAGGNGRADCDSKCRQRVYFCYTGGSECWEYAYSDCEWCTLHAGSQCYINSTDDTNTNCRQVSMVQEYRDGVADTCCTGNTLSECNACTMTGNWGEGDKRYVCKPNT